MAKLKLGNAIVVCPQCDERLINVTGTTNGKEVFEHWAYQSKPCKLLGKRWKVDWPPTIEAVPYGKKDIPRAPYARPREVQDPDGLNPWER